MKAIAQDTSALAERNEQLSPEAIRHGNADQRILLKEVDPGVDGEKRTSGSRLVPDGKKFMQSFDVCQSLRQKDKLHREAGRA